MKWGIHFADSAEPEPGTVSADSIGVERVEETWLGRLGFNGDTYESQQLANMSDVWEWAVDTQEFIIADPVCEK